MKHYYLVEKNQFDSLKSLKPANKNGKDKVLQSNTLNKDNILKVFNNMVNNDRRMEEKSKNQNKLDDVFEKEKGNIKPQSYEYFLKDVPNKSLGREAFDFILQLKGIKLDEYGVISFKEQKVRMEDLLRSILVKQAGVKKNSNALRVILPFVPDKFILNKKAKIIKIQKYDTSDDEYKSPIEAEEMLGGRGGSVKRLFIRKPPFDVKKWEHYYVSWITLKCLIIITS